MIGIHFTVIRLQIKVIDVMAVLKKYMHLKPITIYIKLL